MMFFLFYMTFHFLFSNNTVNNMNMKVVTNTSYVTFNKKKFFYRNVRQYLYILENESFIYNF